MARLSAQLFAADRAPSVDANSILASKTIRDGVDERITQGMIAAYRGLTDGEIASYVEFARSPAGAAFLRAEFAGLVDAMNGVVTRYADELMKNAPSQMNECTGSLPSQPILSR